MDLQRVPIGEKVRHNGAASSSSSSSSRNEPAAATSAQLRATALPPRHSKPGVWSTNRVEAPTAAGDFRSTWPVDPGAQGATPAEPLAFQARHAL